MKKKMLLLPIILVSVLATSTIQAKPNTRISNCIGVYVDGVCYGISWLKAHKLSVKNATPAKVRALVKKDKLKKLKAARLTNSKKLHLSQ
jgi:hypothetical protein